MFVVSPGLRVDDHGAAIGTWDEVVEEPPGRIVGQAHGSSIVTAGEVRGAGALDGRGRHADAGLRIEGDADVGQRRVRVRLRLADEGGVTALGVVVDGDHGRTRVVRRVTGRR